jgi:hypothetical protein
VQTWKSRGKVFFIPQEINKLYYILFWTDTCLNFFIVHLEAHFCNLSCAWDTKLDVGKFRLGRFSRNAALTSVWEWLLYHVAADENVARKDAEEHKDVCVCVCVCVRMSARARVLLVGLGHHVIRVLTFISHLKPWVYNPRPARLYYGTRGHIFKLYIYIYIYCKN